MRASLAREDTRTQRLQLWARSSLNIRDTRVWCKQVWARASCVTQRCQYTCTPESTSEYICSWRFRFPESQCWGFCCPKDISTSSAYILGTSFKAKKQAMEKQANPSLHTNSI